MCFTAFLSPFFPGREEGVDFWPAGGESTPLLFTFFFCYFESRALCCLVVIVYHRFCKRCADVWEERTQSFVSLSNIVCRCEGIQTLLLLTLFVFPTSNVFLFVISSYFHADIWYASRRSSLLFCPSSEIFSKHWNTTALSVALSCSFFIPSNMDHQVISFPSLILLNEEYFEKILISIRKCWCWCLI